jgi:hypothetical protein
MSTIVVVEYQELKKSRVVREAENTRVVLVIEYGTTKVGPAVASLPEPKYSITGKSGSRKTKRSAWNCQEREEKNEGAKSRAEEH